MRRELRKRFLGIAMVIGLSGCMLSAKAQEPGGQSGRGQFAGMLPVAGTVTAVSGDAITVKTEDGKVYQVATTANTRMMKGPGAMVKVSDLKIGDGVMAFGNMDEPNKTLHAAIVRVTDGEELKKLRENLGKTYISGKVTAIDIDNLKMTVARPDGVSQTIGFDETTSFKRGGRMVRTQGAGGAGLAAGNLSAAMAPVEGGESITLADIKVGDNVAGAGSLKGGVFVPGQLNVAVPRAGRGEAGARLGTALQHPATPQPATPQQ
jgi:hypothetical protein